MKHLLAIFFSVCALSASASELADSALREIRFDQKINAQVPLEANFRDEAGRRVRLGDYFGNKPVVLVLGYYGCPMLCTLVANGMVETFHDLKADIGRDFVVLHVSISPSERPELAADKKREYVRHYGRPGADDGWHFLTGDEAAIRRLADAVGFRYAYDPTVKQYAHPSGFIVLTPQGKVFRYFFGVDFRARELSDALQAAAANRTGSIVHQLFLLCFHYSPITSKYGALVLNGVRAIGIVTLLALGFFVLPVATDQSPVAVMNFHPFPEQASTVARESDWMFWGLTAASVFICLLVFLPLGWFAIRYRRGRAVDRHLTEMSTWKIEVTWTLIPLVLVMGLFAWSADAFFRMEAVPVGAIEVNVVGKQWMWKLQHAEGSRDQ